MSLGALDGPASISLEGGNRGTAWAQQSGALELFGISRPGRRQAGEGRKIHALVDSEGLPMRVVVH